MRDPPASTWSRKSPDAFRGADLDRALARCSGGSGPARRRARRAAFRDRRPGAGRAGFSKATSSASPAPTARPPPRRSPATFCVERDRCAGGRQHRHARRRPWWTLRAPDQWNVLELSSFQLETIETFPRPHRRVPERDAESSGPPLYLRKLRGDEGAAVRESARGRFRGAERGRSSLPGLCRSAARHSRCGSARRNRGARRMPVTADGFILDGSSLDADGRDSAARHAQFRKRHGGGAIARLAGRDARSRSAPPS